MTKKIAVVLFNLGGPDSKKAIKPFLMNFFMDRNIVALPLPFRYLLASRIASKRSKQEAGTSYGFLGDRSPLLENSKTQANALQKILNENTEGQEYKVFICMRYWHPMSPQVVQEVRNWGSDKLILLPLYPQFSTTTSWSSLESWNKAAVKAGYSVDTSMVCCYPVSSGFIEASAQNVLKLYEQAIKEGHENPRVLFSAHGLPEKIIKGGDPYQWQCEQGAEKIAAFVAQKLGRPKIDWQICYQSRVGRLKWIEPSTESALEKAAHDKVPVIVYPHAFTQEHVETLVELDIEYRELAHKIGIPAYYRADTVGVADAFIKDLARMARGASNRTGIEADGGVRICPEKFGRCCMERGHRNK